MSKLSLRLALHELRFGWRHFKTFMACLVLGIAVITTVNLLGYAIKTGLDKEAQSLLGGDAELSAGQDLTDAQKQFIQRYGNVSHVVTLRGMASSEINSTLVEIKAVDDKYPLMGQLEFNGDKSRADILTNDGVAVDETLLAQLNLKIGDKINIGNAYYIINATIKKEPDKVVQIFSFGPRVLLSHKAIENSGLISAQSLLKHNYRVRLYDSTRLEPFIEQFKKDNNQTLIQIKTGTDGNATLKSFIEQLVSFLSLAGLATFLIGGIGIGSSVRAYMAKKSNTIAIMKTLGGSYKTILSLYLTSLTVIAIAGCIIGLSAAALITKMLIPFLVTWLPSVEGAKIFVPSVFMLSLWFGVLIVYIFSLPSLLSALKISPSLLFRSNMNILQFVNDKSLFILEAVLIGLLVLSLFLSAGNKLFMAASILLIILTFSIFWACANIIKLIAGRIKPKTLWLKMALNNLYRPGATTGTVIMVIGISLTVLVTLTLTEANFQARIKKVVDEQAPSLFMIDIQPDQKQALSEILNKYSYNKDVAIYPMVRGRITKFNGQEVDENKVADDIRWAIRGDRGLSYTNTQPENADIVAGKWWSNDYSGKPLVSVDERFLGGMGLKIGDNITVNVLGQEVVAEIANARHIDYTTFQINFAMMFSENIMEKFPHSYIATVYLDKDSEFENKLVKMISVEFPGVTIIRTSAAVELVRNIMHHISDALGIAVIISMVTGLLVLSASMAAMLEQKLYDTAILKVLGARKNMILKIYTAEWLILGLVSSLIASAIAIFCSWLVVNTIRGEGFYIMPHIIFYTVSGCMLVICLIGYLGNRRIFLFKPSKLLRNE